eukprot:94787-Pyramimonas_sp.AAC.1
MSHILCFVTRRLRLNYAATRLDYVATRLGYAATRLCYAKTRRTSVVTRPSWVSVEASSDWLLCGILHPWLRRVGRRADGSGHAYTAPKRD